MANAHTGKPVPRAILDGRWNQGAGFGDLVQVGQQFDLVVIAPENVGLQGIVIAAGAARIGILSLMTGSGDPVRSVEVGTTSRLQPGQWATPWASRLWIRAWSDQRCDQPIRKATKAAAEWAQGAFPRLVRRRASPGSGLFWPYSVRCSPAVDALVREKPLKPLETLWIIYAGE